MNLKTKKVTVGSQVLNQQDLSGDMSTKQISASIAAVTTIGVITTPKKKKIN